MEWNNVSSKYLKVYKGKQGKCGQGMVEKKSIKKAKKKKEQKKKEKGQQRQKTKTNKKQKKKRNQDKKSISKLGRGARGRTAATQPRCTWRGEAQPRYKQSAW